MKSQIRIAVPSDADPELTKKLLAAIREACPGDELIQTRSCNEIYHWDGGIIHPSENAISFNSIDDDCSRSKEELNSLLPLGREITEIIERITAHTR